MGSRPSLTARLVAALVALAVTATLGLPFLEGHGTDDLACVVPVEAHDHSAHRIGDAGGEAEDHCEVCHWLRTAHAMSAADGIAYVASVRPVDEPARTVAPVVRSARPAASRAPPAVLL